jgi:hypothetical protein
MQLAHGELNVAQSSLRALSRTRRAPVWAQIALKSAALSADSAAMAVETRFLEHWKREQAARQRARSSLPERWRTDPRPEMAEVGELYVELIAAEQLHNVIPMAFEDR